MPVPHVLLLHLRTSRPHDPDFQARLDVLNRSALAAVGGLGVTGELLAAGESPLAATLAAVDRADAVVVMGGEDVHPRWYGGAATYPAQGAHDPVADEAQLAAIRRCVSTGTPLLGLCRGHQLLNVALGGTLVQHLPTAERHRASGEDPFVSHHVRLLDDGLVEDDQPGLGQDVDVTRPVSCTHHQAVDRLGEGLQVAARSADGVVEAVVGVSSPVTGIQWHPEHPADAAVQLGALVGRLLRQAGLCPASGHRGGEPGDEVGPGAAPREQVLLTSGVAARGAQPGQD